MLVRRIFESSWVIRKLPTPLRFGLATLIVFAFAGLRWLLLRALGARAAFGIQTATDVRLVDPSLFAVGPGSMLAAGTLAAGHFIEKEQRPTLDLAVAIVDRVHQSADDHSGEARVVL